MKRFWSYVSVVVIGLSVLGGFVLIGQAAGTYDLVVSAPGRATAERMGWPMERFETCRKAIHRSSMCQSSRHT